jgi:multiple sugar transport system substrate-binding protein
MDAFAKKTNIKVEPNIIDNNTFQKTINSYLQGTPEDVFTWYAGYRMQVFAKKGLLHPIDKIWDNIKGNFTQATQDLCVGEDGKPYFVPQNYYPTAVFYRKSVFAQRGYKPPATFDEFVALAERMKKDGLVPFSHGIAKGDGWTLLGWFDYLNLRTNGFDFHMELMRGKQSWSDQKVKSVLDHWKRLIPFYQPGGAGRTWQDATVSLVNKQTGMACIGMWIAGQFEQKDPGDLDFFPFPAIDPAYGIDTIEAPTDGFLLSKKPKNLDNALKFLEYAGSAEADNVMQAAGDKNLAPVITANTAKYTPLQRKAAEAIKSAEHTTQFADRDSDPGFMSDVVVPAFASFVADTNKADSVLESIESQKVRYFKTS